MDKPRIFKSNPGGQRKFKFCILNDVKLEKNIRFIKCYKFY